MTIIIQALWWTVGICVGLFILAVCMAGLYFIACLIGGLIKGLIKGFDPPSKPKENI